MRLRLISFAAALMAFASPAFAVMEDYPSIKLQGLDKSVGRTTTFEAKVGSTIQYGPLFIKIHACRKAPPIEAPESAAFLQIWEVPPGAEKSEWAFSGWMFASSPALSAMDHPVYDVWVLDCTGREEPNEEAAAAQSDVEADQTSLPAADGTEALPQEAVPTDSEAGALPADTEYQVEIKTSEDGIETDDDVPVDGEADMRPDETAPAVAPSPYTNPYDAPYSPPQPAQGQGYPAQPAPTPAPQEEGIYSPTQGRVVPAY